MGQVHIRLYVNLIDLFLITVFQKIAENQRLSGGEAVFCCFVIAFFNDDVGKLHDELDVFKGLQNKPSSIICRILPFIIYLHVHGYK